MPICTYRFIYTNKCASLQVHLSVYIKIIYGMVHLPMYLICNSRCIVLHIYTYIHTPTHIYMYAPRCICTPNISIYVYIYIYVYMYIE